MVSPEVARAVEILRAGGLVAFPTETVYGLGADASNADALRRLYRVKARPSDHPVIVHVGSSAALDDWTLDISRSARSLAAEWWPGPLTLVLRAGPRVSRVATGGLETVGIRMPSHPMARELLDGFAGGIAAPSANRFGRVSPTTAAAVRADLGDDIDLLLDGGPCVVGLESTIVDCTAEVPRVLRPGAITAEDIESVLGVAPAIGGAIRAPGTLASHYAPDARVELVAADALGPRVRECDRVGVRVGVLALAVDLGPENPRINGVTLATMATVEEYANGLYSALRKADQLGMDLVLAVPPSPDGIGTAVIDRLRRAAGGR